MSCVEHAAYLAAVADGETELVPPSALQHIRACQRCQAELNTHKLLTARLREALAGRSAGRDRIQSRRLWAAGAAAVLIVVAAISAVLAVQGLTGQDRVLAAADAAQRPPQFQSGDKQAIGTWCELHSHRPMPVVALPQLALLGARFDRLRDTEVVTVDYVTSAGARVTVSWLEATTIGQSGRGVEARSTGSHTVLLVRSPSGSAVVAGDAPVGVLWSVAAQLQASGGS